MNRIALTVAVFALVGLSCASGPAQESTPPISSPSAVASEVVVQNIAFKPASLTVTKGAKVTWRNEDEGVRHTVTSGLPGDKGIPGVRGPKPHKLTGFFDGELDEAGASFTFFFERPGTYSYFCAIHPSMTGEVVVE